MLEGPERRRLEEIERALEAEEPTLARSMRDEPPRDVRNVRQRWCVVGACVGLMLLVICVATNFPGGAFLCVAGIVIAVVTHQRVGRPGPTPPGD